MDQTQENPDFDPTAAIRQPAAEMDEGAPAFSDAPDVEDAPDQQAEPEIDWQADATRWQQEAAAERQRREALEIQQQQILAQAGQAAWDQEEHRNLNHANTLDYESGMAHMRNFYKGRENTILQQAQQTTHAFALNKFADEVIDYWGLGPSDRVRLGADPNQMNGIAESIQTERHQTSSEIEQLRKELKQLKRGQNAERARNDPAYRQGGTRPAGAPGGPVDPNDLSVWTERLTGMLPQRR